MTQPKPESTATLPPPHAAHDAAHAKGGTTGAFMAMLAGNMLLAFGPLLVRMTDVGAVAAGFWRLALAAPVLMLLARREGPRPRLPGHVWVMLAAGGLLFALDLASWHAGIHRTRMANATLFGNVSAFLFPVYGFILARRLPGGLQATALALALAGMMLLLGRSYELSARTLAGDLFSLFAGLCYTGYLIVMERGRARLSSWQTLAIVTAAGVLPLLLFSALLGERIWPGDFTPLVLLALGSQVVGQGLVIAAMGRLSPLVVGLGFLTQPIVSAAAGALFYGEQLMPVDVAGAGMIAVALVLVRAGR